jgi:hypothetical protein
VIFLFGEKSFYFVTRYMCYLSLLLCIFVYLFGWGIGVYIYFQGGRGPEYDVVGEVIEEIECMRWLGLRRREIELWRGERQSWTSPMPMRGIMSGQSALARARMAFHCYYNLLLFFFHLLWTSAFVKGCR